MPLKPEVLDRLLLSKSFLERIRFQPVALHDRHTLAGNIIAAHDSAELAAAAICDHLSCLPQKGASYLMNYIDALGQATCKDVPARAYFRNLNDTRNLLKHQGLFPDSRQWSRGGEVVFQNITKWSSDYLDESFEDIDESALLVDPDVKKLYDAARHSHSLGSYKDALEQIAMALSLVVANNLALRTFDVGVPSSEDAIRLAGFGVHGNDFLALQEFLPHIRRWGNYANVPRWEQSSFGHPGNWTQRSVASCLRTFVDVAVKIQGAQWIPGALKRDALYVQQIEALTDSVEIWRYVQKTKSVVPGTVPLAALLSGSEVEREVVRVLGRGDKIRASVSLARESTGNSLRDGLLGGPSKSKDILDVVTLGEDSFYGQMRLSDVKITCIPRDEDYIRKYFAGLSEFEWDPE